MKMPWPRYKPPCVASFCVPSWVGVSSIEDTPKICWPMFGAEAGKLEEQKNTYNRFEETMLVYKTNWTSRNLWSGEK